MGCCDKETRDLGSPAKGKPQEEMTCARDEIETQPTGCSLSSVSCDGNDSCPGHFENESSDDCHLKCSNASNLAECQMLSTEARASLPIKDVRSCLSKCREKATEIENVDDLESIISESRFGINRSLPASGCLKASGRSCCDNECVSHVINITYGNKNLLSGNWSCESDTSSVCETGKTTEEDEGKLMCYEVLLKRYTSIMKSLGCICCYLVQRGEESCCTSGNRMARKRTSIRRAINIHKKRCNEKKLGSCEEETASVGCCKSEKKTKGDCCGESKLPVSSKCQQKETCETSILPAGYDSDVEKGNTENEHVKLSVSGMTCTGCELKLQRSLNVFEGIRNIKPSMILSRVEFDLDTSKATLQEVMKHLKRTTEFNFEEINDECSTLYVKSPYSSKKFVKSSWPDGVLNMKILRKKIIEISFDPEIVGPRDLIEKGWQQPLELVCSSVSRSVEVGKRHLYHVGAATALSVLLTIPILVLSWAPINKNIVTNSVCLALAAIIQVVIVAPFYKSALRSLIFSRVIDMDLLIVMSTSISFIFSVVSFVFAAVKKPLSTGQFFETSSLLVTLIMIGRFLSSLAVKSVSFRGTQVATAKLIDQNNIEEEIDARLLQYNDIIVVSPYTTIPTDGIVISGYSEINEAMMTGESLPVLKKQGDHVIAGSVNASGKLIVRVLKHSGNNTISRIAKLVENAKLSKPPIQELADRIASYFVPVVLFLASLTFAIWLGVGMGHQKKVSSAASIQALVYAITVLIVSCPCAIGLAVPMVVVILSSVAAKNGVVFKNSGSIEIARNTTDVVFDKTGTLTNGKLSVISEAFFYDAAENKRLLLQLVKEVKHPIAVAIASHLEAQGILGLEGDVTRKVVIGQGIEGTTSTGIKLFGGNARWLNLTDNPYVEPYFSEDNSIFCFIVDGLVGGILRLQDTLRNEALSTVENLKSKGISVHILSGDERGAVELVAKKLGISPENSRSCTSPENKRQYIESLMNGEQCKNKVVVFCGDGTNDSIALAQATIGVHINEGTEEAKSAADVLLVRSNLEDLLKMMHLSRMAMNRIKLNFLWCFIYNVFAILLATGAFVKFSIAPEYAGLGELVSVAPIILLPVQMRWSKIPGTRKR